MGMEVLTTPFNLPRIVVRRGDGEYHLVYFHSLYHYASRHLYMAVRSISLITTTDEVAHLNSSLAPGRVTAPLPAVLAFFERIAPTVPLLAVVVIPLALPGTPLLAPQAMLSVATLQALYFSLISA